MKTRYEFKAGRYSLHREGDGAGDSGMMLEAIHRDPETQEIKIEKDVLEIGKSCRVGTYFARSFQNQDWWMTTPISEFLEVDEDQQKFKFKTGNSVYQFQVL